MSMDQNLYDDCESEHAIAMSGDKLPDGLLADDASDRVAISGEKVMTLGELESLIKRIRERSGHYEKSVCDLQIQRMNLKREIKDLGQMASAMAIHCNAVMKKITDEYEVEA